MTKNKLIIILPASILIVIICVSAILFSQPKDLLLNQFDLVNKEVISLFVVTARNRSCSLEGNLFDKYRSAVNKLRVRELTDAEEENYIHNSTYNTSMLSINFNDGIFIQVYILKNYSESKCIRVLYSIKGDDWKYYQVLNDSIINYDNLQELMDTAETNPDIKIGSSSY